MRALRRDCIFNGSRRVKRIWSADFHLLIRRIGSVLARNPYVGIMCGLWNIQKAKETLSHRCVALSALDGWADPLQRGQMVWSESHLIDMVGQKVEWSGPRRLGRLNSGVVVGGFEKLDSASPGQIS